MRQQSDVMFAQLLSRLRIGKQTTEDVNTLKARQIRADDTAYDTYPHIFSLNVDVDNFNNRCLNSLPGSAVTFNATDKHLTEGTLV